MTSAAYPLKLSFQLVSLAPRIRVVDATGASLMYVQRKVMSIKEQEKVFESEKQAQQLYSIQADRYIGFSARYYFRDMSGREIGSVKHQGMRSLWKAHFDIYPPAAEEPTHYISEDNPWLKVMDSLLSDVALVSMFSGYIFLPSYTLHRTSDDAPILQFKKEPSFFNRSFSIQKIDESLSDDEERLMLLSVLQAVQLERTNT